MKSKSIGIRLTILMLCIILIGIAATLTISLFFSSDTITQEAIETVRMTTLYEAERLDNWLSSQTDSVNALVSILSNMDNLDAILLADQSNETMNFEDQVTDILRPSLKSILDDNAAFFETYMGFADGTAVTGSGFQFNYATWSAPQRGWYKLALTDTSVAHVTSPYVDAQTGELCITIAQAVVSSGKLIGVAGADVYVNELLNLTLSATLDSRGYSMLVDSNGDIIVHPDKAFSPDANGNYKNLNTVMNGAYSEIWKKVSTTSGGFKFPDENGTTHYFAASTISTSGWFLLSALPTSIVTQPIVQDIAILIPIAVGVLIIAAIVIFLTIRNSVSRPIAPVTEFFSKIGSTGDFTLGQTESEQITKYSHLNNEFGKLTNSAVSFVKYVAEISRTLGLITDSDLTADIALLSENDTMGNSLRVVLEKLNEMFSQINASSHQVSTGAKQIADGAQTLAQGSTEQAASIEELSSSISEIAQKIKSNAEMSEKTSKLADSIKENAEVGSRQMDEMMKAIAEINSASQSINKVIKTIDDIAFQTNILALNAAVEAARAGQHGKGFAVVAEEVRNLASKSAEAARETGDMIQNSIEKAELGVHIANETNASLSEIVSGINESSRMISDIAKLSEEQASGIRQVNIGIDQVAQVVQQNSATAEESAAASEEMSSQSAMLQGLISQFRLKEDGISYRGLPSSSARQQRRHIPAPDADSDFSFNSGNNFGKY